MQCRNCYTQLEEGETYCEQCGWEGEEQTFTEDEIDLKGQSPDCPVYCSPEQPCGFNCFHA